MDDRVRHHRLRACSRLLLRQPDPEAESGRPDAARGCHRHDEAVNPREAPRLFLSAGPRFV